MKSSNIRTKYIPYRLAEICVNTIKGETNSSMNGD